MGTRAVGKNSTLSIKKEDGEFAVYPVTDITCDAIADMLEASNTKSEGHQEFEVGFDGATGSVVGNYDPEDNPIPKVKPGTEITMKLTVKGGDTTKTLTIPGYANQLTFGSPVKDLVEFTVNFTASGWDQEDWASF
jgi:hypothetical protein